MMNKRVASPFRIPINLPGIAICLSALLLSPLAQAETATLQHDNNGNVIQRIWVKGKTTQTTTFSYDALNRLIGESGPAKTQTITYDENGNRKSDGAGTYTYETGSNRMLTRRGLSVTTDSLGNITADGTGRTYGFNQANQLYQVFQNGTLIATYEYDTNGLRLSKTTTASAPQGAQTVVYHYDLDGKLIAETTATGSPLRAYIWRDNTPVAQIEYVPSRKVYLFNVDHLNTPRALMDDTGKVVWRWESDAFGSTLPDEDPDGDGVKITSNLRFPGQYYDVETGLHYNGKRYYDPGTGRYITSDPIGLVGGINTYAYALSNPLKYSDPSGLDVTINIRRDTYTSDSVTGAINVTSDNNGGSFSGFTLETATAGPNGDKNPIAPGSYDAFVRSSHGGKRIELRDVDNFEHVQIHVGNTSDDVEGCFAVGKARGKNKVSNSSKAMKKILDIINKDGTGNITINVYGASAKP